MSLRQSASRRPLDIEQAFRNNGAAAYLVATTEGFAVVLGLLAMLAVVGKAGVTSTENRAALAGRRDQHGEFDPSPGSEP